MNTRLILCVALLYLMVPGNAADMKRHPDSDKDIKHDKALGADRYTDPEHGVREGKVPPAVMDAADEPDVAGHTELPPIQPAIDIFPPKWHPGDIIKKTDQNSIDEALDDVMRAGDLLHDRRCAIGIANEGTAALIEPRWGLQKGQIHSVMPQQVKKGETSLNLFMKTTGFLTGTSGVVSYNINGTDYKVAIMWSVPYDTNVYDLWFNIKVYPRWVATDTDLWSHMYYNSGPWKAGYANREEFGVQVRGTMSEGLKSKLAVWINADNLDTNGGYDLHTECGYHAGWFGYYCNQECLGCGWCWVNKRCSYDTDCSGRHVCYTGC